MRHRGNARLSRIHITGFKLSLEIDEATDHILSWKALRPILAEQSTRLIVLGNRLSQKLSHHGSNAGWQTPATPEAVIDDHTVQETGAVDHPMPEEAALMDPFELDPVPQDPYSFDEDIDPWCLGYEE
jgi:hypothetical protein